MGKKGGPGEKRGSREKRRESGGENREYDRHKAQLEKERGTVDGQQPRKGEKRLERRKGNREALCLGTATQELRCYSRQPQGGSKVTNQTLVGRL